MQTYSKRVTNLRGSATIAIAALARKLKEEGKDVLDFSGGEPDFDTPQVVKDEAVRALNVGFTKYTAVKGINELIRAIQDKLRRDNGLDYDMNQIIVSNGAKQSLFNIFQSLIDQDDEVMIPTPCWVTYPELVTYSGGKNIFIPTKEEFQFKARGSDFAKYVTGRTKIIVLTSPSNPTGMVYTKEELEEILQVAQEHNLWIISDEMYEKISYERRPVSIATLTRDKEMEKRIVVVNGLSKCMAMTGWRMGYAACKDTELVGHMCNLQSQSTSNINSITQKAAIVALSKGASADTEYMREEFKKRRDSACDIINDISGINVIKPDGAFYLFMSIKGVRGYKMESDRFCMDLLQQANVALVPGSAFYTEGYVRMSFACSIEQSREGLKRIEEFVKSR